MRGRPIHQPSASLTWSASLESLVPVASIDISGTFDDDLALLQNHLEEDVPCYILARLDDPPSEWLVITYVPDAAKVKQKVITCFNQTPRLRLVAQ